MGGWVSVFAGVLDPAAVREIVAIDSPLTDAPPEEQPIAERPPNKVYSTREEAIARFRTVPQQHSNLPFVERHVAIESLRRIDPGSADGEGGWTWKFDPGIFGQRGWVRDLLPRLEAPLTMVRCGHGMLDEAMAERICGLHRDGARVVDLPDAGHHAMFDQPLALIDTLRALLP
jgi:pimeloyl-ACP methyl ester carboxylesterase